MNMLVNISENKDRQIREKLKKNGSFSDAISDEDIDDTGKLSSPWHATQLGLYIAYLNNCFVVSALANTHHKVREMKTARFQTPCPTKISIISEN